jgi:pimeloyl-ACP methyl ester carboxylesterase
VLTATGLIAALAVPAAASARAATTEAAATSPTAARGSAPLVPVLGWRSCEGGGFECATARVPLDYRHPHGTAISIALLRHPATDPAHRLGTLFVNGGGPNEQIEDFPAAYAQFPAALRARYDITIFDPRGFGYSTAVRCFPNMAAESNFLAALPPFPVGAAQDAAWERTYAAFDARCASQGGALLDHDTTADVARDMDLLRAAVGDPMLNYFGVSYGTGLGAIYANLFPGRVGHMILDGNVNPVAWTTAGPARGHGILPEFLRLGSGRASAAAMTAFLNLCGQTTTAACAFSAGSPAATRAKWTTLLDRLRRHPVTVGSPPQVVTYADAVALVPLGVAADWQSGAAQLQQIWAATSSGSPASDSAAGADMAAPASAFPGSVSAGDQAPAAYTGLEQNLAVLCSDSPNPRDPQDYAADDGLATARAGGFGLKWMWTTEACADWPGSAQDRYTGPWNRPTASTILLIGNTGDDALPYRDSMAMSHDLARARLLTVDGYGHTAANNPSTCALGYEVSYLRTGALPPPGTVCREDTAPFPAPSGG